MHSARCNYFFFDDVHKRKKFTMVDDGLVTREDGISSIHLLSEP